MITLFPSDNISNIPLLWETWSGIKGNPLKENLFPGVGGDITSQTFQNIKTNPAEPVNHLAKSMPQEGGFTVSQERDGRNNYPFHELAKDWDFYPRHCQKRCQKPPSLPKFLVPDTSPRPPSEDTAPFPAGNSCKNDNCAPLSTCLYREC